MALKFLVWVDKEEVMPLKEARCLMEDLVFKSCGRITFKYIIFRVLGFGIDLYQMVGNEEGFGKNPG